jgi:5-formyltetrahydrofolate cyclo-ligase
MLKKEARELYKQKRLALTQPERMKLDDLLLIQFQKAELPFLNTVLSYWPIEENNEPNTHLITSFIEFRNPAVEVAYPKVNETSKNMHAVFINADTAFSKGAFNVPEPISDHIVSPESFDIIIVPLLICDKSGNRVGYGKGFYDQYLKQCRSDCIKVGLQYFEPIDSIYDTNEFDVPLNLCITPQNIYVF